MKEIINRLHENRQIQLAKEILESRGYSVEKESKTLNESWSRTTDDMIDAIDNAQFLLNDASLSEFDSILKSCGANDDDSDPDLGYFAGMSDEQIQDAYNQVRELIKKVIKKMSPMEINNRFFGYNAGGRDTLDAFDLQINQKGELMESSEYDEDSPDDQTLFDAIGTKLVDTLFPHAQFDDEETEKLDAAIEMLVWIHKNLKSRGAI